MPQLTLNCPTCRKRLTPIPLDGLTLHYRCEEHGLLIFKPLLPVGHDDVHDAGSYRRTRHHSTHDAA